MTDPVLIAGAGPTGLTVAIELARRGVPFRIVDRATSYAVGSRGDGLQPRTLEVFERLGVLDRILESGQLPPAMRAYQDGTFVGEVGQYERLEPTAEVPYPNPCLVPQDRTEEILRERLLELGGVVELGTELVSFAQDAEAVTVTVSRDGEVEQVRASYLVGADGGRSVVRKELDVGFLGETDDSIRVVLADVDIPGLDHTVGHWYGDGSGAQVGVGLTPLAGKGEASFVYATPLTEEIGEPDLAYLQERLDKYSGRADLRLENLTWLSVWRPNVRMAEHFNVGRVFLVGDAAHVHPPTGGQGLNTGVQDGFNLGWKLAAVLAGAPVSLLETYEGERLPNAARVLGLSAALLKKYTDGDADAHERGEETRQLDVSYRGGPLSRDAVEVGSLRAGDRAPDGACADGRLFDLFRGTHWTLLTHAPVPERPGVRAYVTDVYEAPIVLVRPDGYVGLVTDDPADVDAYLRLVS